MSAADIAAAKGLGRTVKLLAICERVVSPSGQESVAVRVHPAMIPSTHPLAAVNGAFNAVFVEADAAGELMFYGQGAGGAPTASAVVGDLVAVARNMVASGHGPRESAYAALSVQPMGNTPTRYHVSLDVADKPGVLSQVAAVFAEHDVSIAAVRQEGRVRGRQPGDRHARGDRRRAAVHCGQDRRSPRGAGRRQRDAGGGRRVRALSEQAGPVSSTPTGTASRSAEGAKVVTLHEGGTPLVQAPRLSEADRVRRLGQGRGREPDRLVQGPRYDRGDDVRARRPA